MCLIRLMKKYKHDKHIGNIQIDVTWKGGNEQNDEACRLILSSCPCIGWASAWIRHFDQDVLYIISINCSSIALEPWRNSIFGNRILFKHGEKERMKETYSLYWIRNEWIERWSWQNNNRHARAFNRYMAGALRRHFDQVLNTITLLYKHRASRAFHSW